MLSIPALLLAMTVMPFGESVGATAADIATNKCQPQPHATRWSEDCLPMRLQRYADRHGADLQPARGDIHGHAACWLAIADTTLVMCPDGYATTS